MEQLKEVLKYKFWILLFVGVILTFTGWWMATGALAATIKTRKGAVEEAEKKIPSSPQSIPNDRWSSELAKINDQQQALVTAATRELWERQKARMFWPPVVDGFAKQVPIRGEFPIDARDLYRTNYETDAERVWRLVRPINKFDGSGIVEFPGSRFPMRKWGELAPTSAEMWDAQEDLWLLEPLLEAIRDLNGDESATRLDAAVYTIEKLELVGGQRGQPVDAPSSMSMDGANSLLGEAGATPYAGAGLNSGMGSGGALAGAKFTTVSADFNYKEEFGDGGDPPWKAGSGMGGSFGSRMSSSMFGGAEGGADASQGATESNYRRYVDDDPALPYKTRGFYLSVVMDHRRVPELIAALTANGKSDWPVEIVRVQVARINSDDSDMGPTQGMMAGSSLPGSGFSEGSLAESSLAGPTPFAEGSSAGYDGLGGPASAGFASEQQRPMGEDDLGLPTQPNPNTAAFQNVLRDPYVAKVALCGLIYLYNPVEPPPPAETPATPADPAAPLAEGAPAETNPAATAPADGTTPAEGTPAPTDPAADPAKPESTEPDAATTPPATPEAKTEPPAN